MLKNKVIKADYVEKLQNSGKLNIKNAQELIKKYK